MKILIVDDSSLVRAILKDFLQEEGYEVLEAGNYLEAQTQFTQNHPEIIIKDLYMPEWDAIESIYYFKNLDSKVKIILCSTGSSKDTIMEGLKAGAQDFIMKPLVKSQVLASVKRLAVS